MNKKLVGIATVLLLLLVTYTVAKSESNYVTYMPQIMVAKRSPTATAGNGPTPTPAPEDPTPVPPDPTQAP